MLYSLLRAYRTVAFVGMCKNAGKTTALNRALTGAAEDGAVGLTSIGRDGERQDLVTGTKKPAIYVRRGTLFATAAGLLSACDVTREILETTGVPTPLGEVVLVRALSDGYVQIAGPSITDALPPLFSRFFAFGADRVFLDGAISRKSPAAPAVSEAVVLSTGASYAADLDTIVTDTVRTVRLLTLPRAEGFDPAPDDELLVRLPDGATAAYPRETGILDAMRAQPGATGVYRRGALTDAAVEKLLQTHVRTEGLTLAVEDGSRVLLSGAMLDKLDRRQITLAVVRQTTLAAVTVNPFSSYGLHQDRDALKNRLAAAIAAPVLDVGEE